MAELIWTQGTIPTPPTDSYWRYSAYGNGMTIVLADGGSDYIYTTDGTTWNNGTLPIGANIIYDIVYGNNTFVLICSDTDYNKKILYSTNGTTWAEATATADAIGGICYGKDKFVIVGDYEPKAAYSYDGATWYDATVGSGINFQGVVSYGDDIYISPYNYYSHDGITWQAADRETTFIPNVIEHGNGRFVGFSVTPLAVSIGSSLYSSDGLTWFGAKLPEEVFRCGGIKHAGNIFVAILSGRKANIFTSFDGISWLMNMFEHNIYCVATYGDQFILITADGVAYYGNVTGAEQRPEDIHIDDKTNWQAIVTNWNKKKYAEALNGFDDTFPTKHIDAGYFFDIGLKIADIASQATGEWTEREYNRIITSDEPPVELAQGRVYFDIEG